MTDTSLAMERGELDGTCGWDWSSLKSMKPDWIRDKRVNILFQVGLHPDPELTAMGVPEIWKYRELGGRSQSRRAGRKPAGVHAVLRGAAGDAAGASRHAAHGVRPDHEGSRISCATPNACSFRSSRCPATRCRTWCSGCTPRPRRSSTAPSARSARSWCRFNPPQSEPLPTSKSWTSRRGACANQDG